MRRDYAAAIRRLHDLGVMINGSFVFGMDADNGSVFHRTVEWAIEHGIETATFHILTPYPGTALYKRMSEQGRLTHHDWDLYDTRHAVFRPAHMTADEVEYGYRWAYREFYRWNSIVRGASAHEDVSAGLRHLGLLGGMEEVRAAMGLHHPRQTRRRDASRARDNSERVWTTPAARIWKRWCGGTGLSSCPPCDTTGLKPCATYSPVRPGRPVGRRQSTFIFRAKLLFDSELSATVPPPSACTTT